MFFTHLQAMACGIGDMDSPCTSHTYDSWTTKQKCNYYSRLFCQILDVAMPIVLIILGTLGIQNIHSFSPALSYSMLTAGSVLLISFCLLQVSRFHFNGLCCPQAKEFDTLEYMSRFYLDVFPRHG